jgi:hypothetical protein
MISLNELVAGAAWELYCGDQVRVFVLMDQVELQHWRRSQQQLGKIQPGQHALNHR